MVDKSRSSDSDDGNEYCIMVTTERRWTETNSNEQRRMAIDSGKWRQMATNSDGWWWTAAKGYFSADATYGTS